MTEASHEPAAPPSGHTHTHTQFDVNKDYFIYFIVLIDQHYLQQEAEYQFN